MFKQWRWQSSGAERVFAIIDRREPGNLLKSRATLCKLESQRRVIDESEAPVAAEASLFATPEFGTQGGGRQRGGSYQTHNSSLTSTNPAQKNGSAKRSDFANFACAKASAASGRRRSFSRP
jgi:hypothetical protein